MSKLKGRRGFSLEQIYNLSPSALSILSSIIHCFHTVMPDCDHDFQKTCFLINIHCINKLSFERI